MLNKLRETYRALFPVSPPRMLPLLCQPVETVTLRDVRAYGIDTYGFRYERCCDFVVTADSEGVADPLVWPMLEDFLEESFPLWLLAQLTIGKEA